MDPFSAIKEFLGFGFKINSVLETAGDNAKGCRRIDDLLGTVRAIAKHLQGLPNIMEDDSMKGLRQALERASEFVANNKGKPFVSRAFNAGGIAEKLRGVCQDVQLNMTAVLLANMAELRADVIALLANDALTKKNMDKILLIVTAQQEEMAKLVKNYQISSEIIHKKETKKTDVASSQTKNERETKKTGVASSQNENKREAKETDVARQEDKIQKNNRLRETEKTVVASSQTKNGRETKKTGVASSQNKNKREAKKRDVARQEDKIQKNNKLRGSTVVPDASLPDGLAESASAASVVGQYDASSTIINKASSSILVDEAESVGVSTAPFHPQKIISISEEPGATGRYKISPHSSKTSKQGQAQDLKIISRSIENKTLVTSIDAHPTKTWIVMGHKGGSFSIWDYQKQKTVEFKVNKVPGKGKLIFHACRKYIKETPLKHPVFSAKFIAEGKQLVVGDGHGYIYVYDCTDIELRKVKEFKAHDKSVNSLAAHPTKPHLFSSSAFCNYIKVWDWNNDWKQIQNIHMKPEVTYYDGVFSVKFNPRDTDTFACVTDDKSVKVWNPKTSSLETTLKGPYVEADYFFTRSHQRLMVTLRSDSHNSEIRDLKTGKVVHTLSVSGRKTTQVACHPKLPILVTTLDDGTVCLWDASTYRLEKRVHITDSECRDLVFLPDTNGLTRLAVAFEKMIAIMEVNLPIANTSNASG